MHKDVKIPTVGESITEVEVARWLKKDGDGVKSGDLICEIESDKASFDIPVEYDGILRILVQEGESVEIGGSIARIEVSQESPVAELENTENGSTEDEQAATEPKETIAKITKYEIKVPAVGESITEVTIAQWLKKNGQVVNEGDLICEIESDKASFEIPAEQGGIMRALVTEGDTVEVGAVIAEIHTNGQTVPATPGPSQTVIETPQPDKRLKATPVAAKILQEAGLATDFISPSGAGGRITKDDALKAVKKANKRSSTEPQVEISQETKPPQAVVSPQPPAGDRAVRKERMSALRKTVARRLVEVKNETAMLTTFNEVDMTGIKALRTKYKDSFKEKYDVGLGFMSFFCKAVNLAITEWPALNAKIDGSQIVYHEYCDISIAVSTSRGLVVPVIRNIQDMSLADIEREVLRLALKARDGQLKIEEMTGGTFTITNGGVFGSMMSTPIINAPQSAILGMHNIVDRPVVVNGQIVIRPMMYVALSYDHRIIDGRESVSFLVRVKQLLEDPARMLLEV